MPLKSILININALTYFNLRRRRQRRPGLRINEVLLCKESSWFTECRLAHLDQTGYQKCLKSSVGNCISNFNWVVRSWLLFWWKQRRIFNTFHLILIHSFGAIYIFFVLQLLSHFYLIKCHTVVNNYSSVTNVFLCVCLNK